MTQTEPRTLLRWIGSLSLALSAGCVLSCTSVSRVRHIGDGRYTVSGTATSGWVDADDAFEAAITEAERFCSDRGKTMVMETNSGTATSGDERMPVNNQRLNFRCDSQWQSSKTTNKSESANEESSNTNKPNPNRGNSSIKFKRRILGKATITKRHDNDRDSDILSFRYGVTSQMHLHISIASADPETIAKTVSFQLVSDTVGKPFLATLSSLTIVPGDGRSVDIPLTWYKEIRGQIIRETLTGTINVAEFVGLLGDSTSLEFRGENMEFALTSSAIEKLKKFSSYLHARVPKLPKLPKEASDPVSASPPS